MNNLLSGLVSSKTRIKLLIRLFANPKATAHLRGLAGEFGLSTNSIREELIHLSSARLLTKARKGRQIVYRANAEHPLFNELSAMVHKVLGIDQVVKDIVGRLGRVERALLIGDYAEGKDTGIIDLILVGAINRNNLADLVAKTEKYIKRKIRTLVLTEDEYQELVERFMSGPHLVLWDHGSEIA